MQGPQRHAALSSSRLVAGLNWRQMTSPVIARKHAAAASGACRGYSSTVRMAVTVAVLLLVLFYLLSPSEADHAAQPRQLSTRRCPQQHQPPVAASNRSAAASTGSTTIAGEQVAWQRPALLLLGDSLTEFGAQEGGWGAKLTAAYTRKADVINRGFHGYTSSAARNTLPALTPLLKQRQVLLATVLLGTNDATLPDTPTGRNVHVPVETYAANLLAIAQQLQAAGAQHVLIVTPPPLNDAASNASQRQLRRTNAALQPYADAAHGVALKLSLPVLDLTAVFKQHQDWAQRLLREDGVHLSQAGNEAVFGALMQLTEQKLPGIRPAALPQHHPTWSNLGPEGGKREFEAAEKAYWAAAGGC